MAEANGNNIGVKLPWVELKATGQFVINVILMVGLIAVGIFGWIDFRNTIKTEIINSRQIIIDEIRRK